MAVIALDFDLYVAAMFLVVCVFIIVRWRRPPARGERR
jgi:hypothetical protein